MARKVVYVKKQPDPKPVDEGLPPWMATFADMVTLLLCFFVLLLSFAKQDLDKFRDVLGSLKDAFGSVSLRAKSDTMALITTSSKKDELAPASQEEMVMAGVVVRIKSLLEEDPENKKLQNHTGVSADKEGALMRTDAAILFKPGTADLTPEAQAVLSKIITVLKEYNLFLVVRAHTDNQPPTDGRYPSNWELSAARAAKVLAYLCEVGGIEDKRLKAVGYAQTQPLAPNDTQEHKDKNNRVEFYFHQPGKITW